MKGLYPVFYVHLQSTYKVKLSNLSTKVSRSCHLVSSLWTIVPVRDIVGQLEMVNANKPDRCKSTFYIVLATWVQQYICPIMHTYKDHLDTDVSFGEQR